MASFMDERIRKVVEQAKDSKNPILFAAITKYRAGIHWETCMEEAALALDRHANHLHDKLVDCLNLRPQPPIIIEKEQSHGD